jgi:hypothetical protein
MRSAMAVLAAAAPDYPEHAVGRHFCKGAPRVIWNSSLVITIPHCFACKVALAGL